MSQFIDDDDTTYKEKYYKYKAKYLALKGGDLDKDANASDKDTPDVTVDEDVEPHVIDVPPSLNESEIKRPPKIEDGGLSGNYKTMKGRKRHKKYKHDKKNKTLNFNLNQNQGLVFLQSSPIHDYHKRYANIMHTNNLLLSPPTSIIQITGTEGVTGTMVFRHSSTGILYTVSFLPIGIHDYMNNIWYWPWIKSYYSMYPTIYKRIQQLQYRLNGSGDNNDVQGLYGMSQIMNVVAPTSTDFFLEMLWSSAFLFGGIGWFYLEYNFPYTNDVTQSMVNYHREYFLVTDISA